MLFDVCVVGAVVVCALFGCGCLLVVAVGVVCCCL